MIEQTHEFINQNEYSSIFAGICEVNARVIVIDIYLWQLIKHCFAYLMNATVRVVKAIVSI